MKIVKEVDASVIIALRNGSESAFRKVYNTYNSRLYHFAYRFLKSDELCEEVIQETMISLWLNKDRLDEKYPLGSYLYMITRRLSLNILRKQATSQVAFNKVIQSALFCHNETEDGVIFNDLSCVAETMVTKLPNKQQEVFRLSRYQGLSHKEIAERMKLSENTIQNHIGAALKSLRLQFKRSDIFFLLLIYFC
ncbi:RNA polymerase sigma-70 factor [Mucilaginibacter sp.]|uniref:RNA polymerase sigma factor n=1 Tax=Mucilaginibacter sp. TaxID=1882438 RepID=UPI00326528E7